jgi:hypothetical protein
MVDSSCVDLLAELNAKRRAIRSWPFALILAALAWMAIPYAVVAGALLVFLCYWWDIARKTSTITYELDSATAAAYDVLQNAFDQMAASKAHWHVAAAADCTDPKRNAGASSLLARGRIRLRKAAPSYVKTNVDPPMVSAGKQTLYFFPDRVFVFESAAVGVVPYADLVMKVRTSRFIEQEGVPGDARTVDSTWKYPNKSGGPDRRYRDNPQIPIVEYEQIWFESATGLNEVLQVSRVGAAAQFAQAVRGMASVHP